MGERLKTLAAAQFWAEFKTAFESSSLEPSSALGIYYNKLRVRGSEARDSEWTHLMAAFLSGLASTLGFYQEWERKRLDFLWYEGTQSKPSVTIEHESYWPSKIKVVVRKLTSHPAPLKVLITYIWPAERVSDAENRLKEILSAVEKVVRSSRSPLRGEFAIVCWRRSRGTTGLGRLRLGRREKGMGSPGLIVGVTIDTYR